MRRLSKHRPEHVTSRLVTHVWEKDVWDFQAKSGTSGSCPLFFYFLQKIAVHKSLGIHLEKKEKNLVPDAGDRLMKCHEVSPGATAIYEICSGLESSKVTLYEGNPICPITPVGKARDIEDAKLNDHYKEAIARIIQM